MGSTSRDSDQMEPSSQSKSGSAHSKPRPACSSSASCATHGRRTNEQRLKLVHDLGERVKELTALHQIARLLHQGREPSVLLKEVVNVLPSAWQYPQITAVRVVFQDIDVRTASFAPSGWSQRAEFGTTTSEHGFIEVVYREPRPAEVEGPFLAEERNLLNSLAELLGEIHA
jgi:hypothetical protein